MKITVLCYLEKRGGRWDVVVDQVTEALRANGHRVSVLAVHDEVSKLIGSLRRRQPDLVFNLLEMFAGDFHGDTGVVGLMDLLGLRYTGGGPGELYLRLDKGLAKRLLAYEKLLYPEFAVFYRDRDLETGGNLRMPLFVKPLRGDASAGIDGRALVSDAGELMRQVRMIHQKHDDAAIAEQYIEGRELYVGVLGNRLPTVFPPVEIDFSGLPDGAPRVMDAKAKWDVASRAYKGTRAVMAEMPDELRARVQKVALEAYRALRVRDYGRVDLRVTEAGEIYVIEVNASCYLERGSEFAMAAAAGGVDYEALIARIVEEAVGRYESGPLTAAAA